MASLTKKRRKHNRVVKKFLDMGREIPADLRTNYEETIKAWLLPSKRKMPVLQNS